MTSYMIFCREERERIETGHGTFNSENGLVKLGLFTLKIQVPIDPGETPDAQ